jgi:uncharacterized protein with HEPN domain
MPPEAAKFLRDMLDAARAIEQYTAGVTRDEFLDTRWRRDAAQWNFCVIGEALSQLSKVDEATAKRLSEQPRIIAFRNQLIHGYGVIDSRITWDVIHKKLPVLVRELEAALKEAAG